MADFTDAVPPDVTNNTQSIDVTTPNQDVQVEYGSAGGLPLAATNSGDASPLSLTTAVTPPVAGTIIVPTATTIAPLTTTNNLPTDGPSLTGSSDTDTVPEPLSPAGSAETASSDPKFADSATVNPTPDPANYSFPAK